MKKSLIAALLLGAALLPALQGCFPLVATGATVGVPVASGANGVPGGGAGDASNVGVGRTNVGTMRTDVGVAALNSVAVGTAPVGVADVASVGVGVAVGLVDCD